MTRKKVKAAVLMLVAVVHGLLFATAAFPSVEVSVANKYEKKSGKSELSLVQVKLTGMPDEEEQDALNEMFEKNVLDKLSVFDENAEDARKCGYGYSCQSNYSVLTDDGKFLCFVIEKFEYSGGAHGMPGTDYYVIDQRTGRLLKLEDMFEKGSNYSEILTKIIKRQMLEIGKDDFFYDTFAPVEGDQQFYINEKGELVICYQRYDIAPYSTGSPKFTIPNSEIESIRAIK